MVIDVISYYHLEKYCTAKLIKTTFSITILKTRHTSLLRKGRYKTPGYQFRIQHALFYSHTHIVPVSTESNVYLVLEISNIVKVIAFI